jgi:hypothetical protein
LAKITVLVRKSNKKEPVQDEDGNEDDNDSDDDRNENTD